jgi:hypothetical protein
MQLGETLLKLGDLRAGELAPMPGSERPQHALFVGRVEDRPGRKGVGGPRVARQQGGGREGREAFIWNNQTVTSRKTQAVT